MQEMKSQIQNAGAMLHSYEPENLFDDRGQLFPEYPRIPG